MKYNNHNLCLLVTLLAGCLSLGWIDPLADKVREGNRLYQAGKYDEALGQYVDAQLNAHASPQLDFNTADAQYKRGKFDDAARLFGKVLKSDDAAMKAKSCFNMGNTLYRQNKMEDALEYYKKTLDYVDGVAPGSNEFETLKHDAQYNYEYVKKKIKEQEQKQQQQKNQKDKNQEDQQQKEDPNKKDDKPDQEKGENKDPEKENQDSPKNDEQRQRPENKPETGEDHKDEKQEQPENDRQKNQRQDQPQGQQAPQHQEKQQMSREEAERLLEALNQSEKEARATIKDAHRAQHKPVEKDW